MASIAVGEVRYDIRYKCLNETCCYCNVSRDSVNSIRRSVLLILRETHPLQGTV